MAMEEVVEAVTVDSVQVVSMETEEVVTAPPFRERTLDGLDDAVRVILPVPVGKGLPLPVGNGCFPVAEPTE